MHIRPRLVVAVVAGTVLLPGAALAKGGPKASNHGQMVSAVARGGGDVVGAAHRRGPVRVPKIIDRCATWQSQLAQLEVRIAAQNGTITALEAQLAAARAAGNTRLAARLASQLASARRTLINLQAQVAKLRLTAPCSTGSTTTVPTVTIVPDTTTTVPPVSIVPVTTTVAPTTTAAPTTVAPTTVAPTTTAA